MCFVTDGVPQHWNGRRAWRKWIVKVVHKKSHKSPYPLPRVYLDSPMFYPVDDELTWMLCIAVSDRFPNTTKKPQWDDDIGKYIRTKRAGHGLYAYTGRLAQLTVESMCSNVWHGTWAQGENIHETVCSAYGSVFLYGDGYRGAESYDSAVYSVSAESMVIESVYLPTETPKWAIRALQVQYPFVEFRTRQD